MEDDMKQRLTRRDVWVRALYMIFFVIAYTVAEVVLGIVTLVQFVFVLVTGNANENLLRLGNNLSAYVYQVFRFLTFNSETQAFPFSEWPDEAIAEDNMWMQEDTAAEVAQEAEVTSPEAAAEPQPAPEAEPQAAAAEEAQAEVAAPTLESKVEAEDEDTAKA